MASAVKTAFSSAVNSGSALLQAPRTRSTPSHINKDLLNVLDTLSNPDKYYDEILEFYFYDKGLPTIINDMNFNAKTNMIKVDYILRTPIEAYLGVDHYKIINDKPVKINNDIYVVDIKSNIYIKKKIEKL